MDFGTSCASVEFSLAQTLLGMTDVILTIWTIESAYGSLQGDRSIDRVQEYWEQRHLWEPLINKKDLSLIEVYNFLLHSSVVGGRSASSQKKGSQPAKSNNKSTSKKVFVNIGSLTAILIIGDLIYAGILPMPSPLDLWVWASALHGMYESFCGL